MLQCYREYLLSKQLSKDCFTSPRLNFTVLTKYDQNESFCRTQNCGTQEMAYWLGALTTLPEDTSLIPRHHKAANNCL